MGHYVIMLRLFEKLGGQMKKNFYGDKFTAKENMTLCEKICFYDEILQTKKLNQQEAIIVKTNLQELKKVATDRDAIVSIRDLLKKVRPLAN